MKFLFIFLLALLVSNSIWAQGSHYGCLFGNIVYKTEGSRGNYDGTVGLQALSSGYCSWTPTTGVDCLICGGGLNPSGNCKAGTNFIGKENTFTMVLCPLDDYVFILLSLISLITMLNVKTKMFM